MYLMIDNYDSFVYNLYAYMLEKGQDVRVIRADDVDMDEVRSMNPEGVIISPGPKRPEDADVSEQVLSFFEGRVPVLGVCLGHQLIGYHYGANVRHGATPVHGKISPIKHDGSALFADLPESFRVTRYHSLVVEEQGLPECLTVTARTEDGVIMGLQHKELPVYGVQFHPEAVLTEYGHELLANFDRICKSWKALNGAAAACCDECVTEGCCAEESCNSDSSTAPEKEVVA